MTITIRTASLDDAEALASLARTTFIETFVEGFAMNYPASDLEDFLRSSYAPEHVALWLAGGAERVRVATDDGGELLAYAQCGPNSLPLPGSGPLDGELKRLYVARRAQGLGLGRGLLEDSLEALGVRRILIGVWSGNDKAIRLYARYGFRPAGAYRFAVGRTLDEELILSRDPNVGVG